MRPVLPHEISLRRDAYGGDLREAALEIPEGLISRRREIILLIHGFNVNTCDAGCSYDQFLTNARPRVAERSVLVYWPGDVMSKLQRNGAKPGFWSKVVSALSYPYQRQTAVASAKLLAKLIASSLNERDNVKLTIVAHSLGCRVALELLERLTALKDARQISIPLTVLMAAAVPRYLVTRGDLKDVLTVSERVIIYRSFNDDVLKWTFHPGQALETPFPEGWNFSDRVPLGRGGLGRLQSTRLTNVTEIEATCNHGGYWPNPHIAHTVGNTVFGTAWSLLGMSLTLGDLSDGVPRSVGRRLRGRTIEARSLNSSFRKSCGNCWQS